MPERTQQTRHPTPLEEQASPVKYRGGTPLIQRLIDEGWRDPYAQIKVDYDHDESEWVTHCVSLYFGTGGHSAVGGATHVATVYDRYGNEPDHKYRHIDGWDITRLDKWGGAGSRGSMAHGLISDDLPDMRASMQRITQRQQSRQGARRR